jgi:S-adenosylmethionine hydrolase
MRALRPITLLTDFGTDDTYVGQVKGAILAVAPAAPLVDLTHAVPPQDVEAAEFLLWTGVEVFPAGTVHLAVVDPGVGSPRRAIALRSARGDLLVGPDNGVLVPAATRLGGIGHAVELTARQFWRTATSTTFHGRDLFGPVAAHLASGVDLRDVGRLIDDPVRLEIPSPDGPRGQVIHIDGFGNLVTNIPAASLPLTFQVRLEGRVVPRAPYYAATAPGELLALVGSAGLLEISARDASAAQLTRAVRGAPVRVEELA